MKIKYITKLVFIFSTVMFIIGYSLAFASDKNDEVIRMAEHAILANLVLETSEHGRYLCVNDKMACLGSNQAEMGLAIIASKNDAKYYVRLVNLMKYQMDGALSEEYTCYMLDSGDKLKKYLNKIKPKALENNCLSEFKKFTKNKPFLGTVNSKDVCRSSTSIKKEIDDFLNAIVRKDKCSDDK
jgi:hypothetical protein